MAYEKGGTGSFIISITGIVQGVGFRPFVYREAVKFGLSGTVRNNAGAVEIIVNADEETVKKFAESLRKNAPDLSFIETLDIRYCEGRSPEAIQDGGFHIIDSSSGAEAVRFFSPDIALCESCRAEIFDGHDRRFGHYFNNCTACGPRFSVLKNFPYDRDNTSMDVFPMCEKCAEEYHAAGDRRFHAETVCCKDCGPTLTYTHGSFEDAVKDLQKGEIIAVKGIGGYHLACLPESEARLREMKGRETKPFALMFANLEAVKEVCAVSREEEKLLTSSARPIVLLKLKNGEPGRLGCFLPYTPVQEILLREASPLIMTSANHSSSPIIKDDAEIFSLIGRVLAHDREIVRAVEDSVAQVVKSKPQLIRRARGYTPLPVFYSPPLEGDFPPVEENREAPGWLLAFGSDLKSAFGILQGNVFTLSQFIGDLENANTLRAYEEALADFENLFAFTPQAVVCDAHPRYFSTRLAKKYAAEKNIPFVQIYHHHAHIASVMAEHKLKKVIGVAFDGSGYGEDGTVWGGEFLICEGSECRRVGHLAPVELLGADDAARDAAKTAACYVHACAPTVIHTDNHDVALIKSALAHHVNTFTTSSMGRLFDAVASLLGVCAENSYEGECATLLQYAAEEEARAGAPPIEMKFTQSVYDPLVFEYKDIIEKCLGENKKGAALGFHLAVCEMVKSACEQIRAAENINTVALSGGVFQNSFLLEMISAHLAARGFDVYTNEAVPPNDGGIALGQAFILTMKKE